MKKMITTYRLLFFICFFGFLSSISGQTRFAKISKNVDNDLLSVNHSYKIKTNGLERASYDALGEEVNSIDKPIINNRFEFYYSYGICYVGWLRDKESVLRTSHFGSIMEVGLDYRLPGNRFIGVTFIKQERNQTVKDKLLLLSDTYGLWLDNYHHQDEVVYFGINFRTEFNNRLHLTFGLAYFLMYENFLSYRSVDETLSIFVLNNSIQRADNIAISLAVDYYFPIKDYFEIGIRAKSYLTLNGLEPLSLAPIVKFSF